MDGEGLIHTGNSGPQRNAVPGAYSILRNDDACRDAMQDAVLKAWERRRSLREIRYFRSWITRILFNTCYDTKRKLKHLAPADTLPDSLIISNGSAQILVQSAPSSD